MRRMRTGERGAIAVVGAIVLLAVGAIMALAVNVGMAMHARGQLQNGSDSAALAAATSLNGMAAGLTAADNAAQSFSAVHEAIGESITIDPATDVEFGRWHFKAEDGWAARTFEPLADPLLIDAVRVRNGRDRDLTGRHNSSLSVFFGNWLGTDKSHVSSHAIAVGEGARTDCPMPFVLPACSLESGGAIVCGQDITLILSPDGTDNVGFIFFLPGGTGNSDVPPNILDRCVAPVATASEYPVSNGNDLNDKVVQAILGLADVPQGNDLAPYSTPDHPLNPDGSSSLCAIGPPGVSFPLAELDGGCPNPKFNQDVVVAQFAQVIIQSVSDANGFIYDSCPTGTISKWGDYQKTLQVGEKKRKMVVHVVCGPSGGLSYSSGPLLRLVE